MILEILLLGISLSADSFAVSLCSAASLDVKTAKQRSWRVGLIFALIQSVFTFAGWLLAKIFSDFMADKIGHFTTITSIIGFLLLLYVGGSMLFDALSKKESESLNLNGLRNILIGGVATSIDAFAVGISLACNSTPTLEMLEIFLSVFVFTALAVILGMNYGSRIGAKLGKPARIIGGLILILLGVNMLI